MSSYASTTYRNTAYQTYAFRAGHKATGIRIVIPPIGGEKIRGEALLCRFYGSFRAFLVRLVSECWVLQQL